MRYKTAAVTGVFFAMLIPFIHAGNINIDAARKLLLANKAACVLMSTDGKIVACENGRGISPLLNLYDKFEGDLKDRVVVDKVIGRATAAIAVCGKVRYVHAEVMSRGAVDILKKHNIAVGYTLLVPQILNRTKDGLCPMEQTVMNIDDPVKAVSALRKKLVEMRQAAATAGK